MKAGLCSLAVPAILGIVMASSRESAPASPQSDSVVEIQMRSVSLHLDPCTVLEVRRLRGEMVPTRAGQPVTFDDAASFATHISSAEIAIRAATLSYLLNERVFAYPGAPLKHITIETEKGRVKQTGIVHEGVNLPFEVEGPLDVTPGGEVRLHAKKVTSAHVPVAGLLHLFGEDLSKLVKVKPGRGVRLEGDDILIQPGRLLPPPQIEGKITAARVDGDRIVLTFQSVTASELNPPYKTASYIYHRGGLLRFGKLTMTDADLEIVSESGKTPFDFSLPEYNRQLVAGYSKNTESHGLIVFMRDLKDLNRGNGSVSIGKCGA